MRAPAETPHADEALRALFERFKRDPGSLVFGELADALLARGHATEALQIAEHGLQLNPADAEGRVHRAAALLALQRPKVAYVELLRVLAIDGRHAKALRLLGKVYVEAGKPTRAAALLRRRHAAALLPPDPTVATAPMDTIAAPKIPPPLDADRGESSGHSPIPDLFKSLTVDLGLGTVPNDFDKRKPRRRVEVTQVMRARVHNNAPLPRNVLSSIDGPIVDTSRPGRLEETQQEEIQPAQPPRTKPSSVYDVVTSPEFHITVDGDFLADAAPIGVKPVPGVGETETVVDHSTEEDGLPSMRDLELLREAMESPPVTEQAEVPAAERPTNPSADAINPIELGTPIEQGKPIESDDAAQRKTLSDEDREVMPTMDAPAYAASTSAPKASTSIPPPKPVMTAPANAPLTLAKPQVSPVRLFLGITVGVALIVFVVGMGWIRRSELSVWLDIGPKGQSVETQPLKSP